MSKIPGWPSIQAFERAYQLPYGTTVSHLKKGYCKWPRKKCNTGDRSHPLYSTYASIKTRCYNLRHKDYPYYGGRGIKMYSGWYVSFAQFKQDIALIGPKPTGYTLDRIDNSGDYTPGNIRWASRVEQVQNQRLQANNTSGVRGLHWDSKGRRWVAQRRYAGTLQAKSFRVRGEAEKFLASLKLSDGNTDSINTTTSGSSK